MFIRVAPQVVRHRDGYTVQVGSRERMEYFDEEIVAHVAMDIGTTFGIYPETLQIRAVDGGPIVVSPERRHEILERIKAGMTALDIPYELCELKPR